MEAFNMIAEERIVTMTQEQMDARLKEVDYKCDICGRDWYSTIIDKYGVFRVLCDFHFDNPYVGVED